MITQIDIFKINLPEGCFKYFRASKNSKRANGIRKIVVELCHKLGGNCPKYHVALRFTGKFDAMDRNKANHAY